MYIGMDNVESSSHLFLKMEEIKRILIFYAVERCFKSFIELSSTVEPLQTFWSTSKSFWSLLHIDLIITEWQLLSWYSTDRFCDWVDKQGHTKLKFRGTNPPPPPKKKTGLFLVMCLFSSLVFFVVENARNFTFSTNSSSILQLSISSWVSEDVLLDVSQITTNMTFFKLKFERSRVPALQYNKFQISFNIKTCWLIWKHSFIKTVTSLMWSLNSLSGVSRYGVGNFTLSLVSFMQSSKLRK